MLASLKGRRPERAAPSPDLMAATGRLRENANAVSARLEGLSQADLERALGVFGEAWAAHRLIDFAREHEIHHKGQLRLVAQVLGVEPPMFVRF